MPLKHNKKRDAGLVYEFLVRKIASTIINRDPDSYLKSIKMIKKYFSPGQPLAQEKEIFDAVCSSRSLSETEARKVLTEMKKYVEKLDSKKIEIKKSNLIKDINYTFGKNFFDVHRVPEYRLYASIQMLIETYLDSAKPMSESVEHIRLEEGLVKYMMSSKSESKNGEKKDSVDSLVASLAMKKFEERYGRVLNESQKKTLRKFMNYSMTGNKEQFRKEMEEDKKLILRKLEDSKRMKCFIEDSVMAQRLEEAIVNIKNIDDITSDEAVQENLLYGKLLQELDSDD